MTAIGCAMALVAVLVGGRVAVAVDAAPTIAEAASATYRGLEDLPAVVPLRGGVWEGEPFVAGGASRPRVELVRELRLVGDVGADGTRDAAVFLAASSGGSGTFLHLAVLSRRDDGVANLATAPVGDRVQIRAARVEGGRIVLDLIQAGPEDARCCPGETVTRTFAMPSADVLVEQESVRTGRLSPAILEGRQWVLRRIASDEDAPATPVVTLTVEGDQWSGSSGCNRYSTTATPGAEPGAVAIGPIAGTRMMCPEAVMAVEDRYLAALATVVRYGFLNGRLTFTTRDGGRTGILAFEERALGD